MADDIKTEFNSNLATLIRIDNALKMASRASIIDDYAGWFKALGIVRREAIVKMKPEQKIECNNIFLKLERNLTKILGSKAKVSFVATKIDNDLDRFEIYLREIMDKKGMLLRDADIDLSGI